MIVLEWSFDHRALRSAFLPLHLGASEQRLNHPGSDRHDPGQRSIDLGCARAGSPRAREAAHGSRLTVAGQDYRQTNERFCLVVERGGVSTRVVKPFELFEQALVLGFTHPGSLRQTTLNSRIDGQTRPAGG
jgi:hypothetical protein